jgi:hypothetical protein
MKPTSTLLVLALTAAAPAFAQPMAPPDPAARYMLPIGHLDVRATGSTTMFFNYVGVGVNADYALLPLGPMTLTVGGEVSYDTCLLSCALYALPPYNESVSDTTITPAARATLHFPLASIMSQPTDVYVLVSAGLMIANHSSEDANSTWAWHATAIGPTFGGGFGGNYMWGSVFFTGAELTLTYRAYVYTPVFTSGGSTVAGEELTGSGSNLLVRLFLGLRF